MTWRCSWQDYRGWPWLSDQAPPRVSAEDYETREQADKRALTLKQEGFVTCVSPTPSQRTKRQRDPAAFNVEWKLTR